ncbi:hypothetical protein V6N11_022559 [Hibiscus sabdariffa]|uniref:Reverse transcriptase zinc-binding domain-containing protein n=1 Tax=Hibiscus sabdariffa TaxID=183260 RepID=A0ABR2TKB0_9ROSI
MLILHYGFFWQVGIDSPSPIFAYVWGGHKHVVFSERYLNHPSQPITCGDFMIPSHNGWDVARVREVFLPTDADQILNCPIANRYSDLLVWGNHSSGTYSTRSVYTWLMKPTPSTPPSPKLWHILAKLKTLPKIRIFIWRLAHEAFPVAARIGLRHRGLKPEVIMTLGMGIWPESEFGYKSHIDLQTERKQDCTFLRIERHSKDEGLFLKNGSMLLEKLIVSSDAKRILSELSRTNKRLQQRSNLSRSHYHASLDSRMEIAMGIATAAAYLHIALSRPVIN